MTINTSDVVNTVVDFTAANSRPCPAKYLAEKFGSEVHDVIDSLKESGVLLGLRGRNGGLAIPGSEIVAKRAEYAAKKAAKATTVEPVTNEVAAESAA